MRLIHGCAFRLGLPQPANIYILGLEPKKVGAQESQLLKIIMHTFSDLITIIADINLNDQTCIFSF